MTTCGLAFTAESVLGILSGAKTQTRRLLALPNERCPDCSGPWRANIGAAFVDPGLGAGPYLKIPCTCDGSTTRVRPRWAKGDTAWVKETYAIECEEDGPPPFSDGRPIRQVEGFGWEQCHYRASDPTPDLACEHKTCVGGEPCRRPWRSPRFMPRELSRIDLEILDLRIERLHQITEEDAKAEGCTSVLDYKRLWNTIHAKKHDERWLESQRGETSPWVECLTFRRTRP